MHAGLSHRRWEGILIGQLNGLTHPGDAIVEDSSNLISLIFRLTCRVIQCTPNETLVVVRSYVVTRDSS